MNGSSFFPILTEIKEETNLYLTCLPVHERGTERGRQFKEKGQLPFANTETLQFLAGRLWEITLRFKNTFVQSSCHRLEHESCV